MGHDPVRWSFDPSDQVDTNRLFFVSHFKNSRFPNCGSRPPSGSFDPPHQVETNRLFFVSLENFRRFPNCSQPLFRMDR